MSETKKKTNPKKRDMPLKKIRTITMPEEFGGTTYTIKKKLPYNIYKQLLRSASDEDSDGLAQMELVLKHAILEPKITQADLDDDETDGLEMTILAQEVMDVLNITPERIEELKKKVVKR